MPGAGQAVGACTQADRGTESRVRNRAMSRRSQKFPAKMLIFNQIREFIEEFSQTSALASADRHKLTLVVEELFSNTVNHGHGGDSDACVEISLELADKKVTVVYQDSAPPYDSLAAAMRTDINATINQRRVGGLGMVMTFALAETAQYSYLDNHNRLVITLLQSGQ
jgi:serine/threonine-protein kinase RsbW